VSGFARVAALGLVALAAATATLAAQPPIHDARIEPAEGLAPRAAAARSAASSEPVWIGWSVAAVPGTRELCCGGGRFGSRRCSLAEEPDTWGDRDGEPDGGILTGLVLLVEHRGGRPNALRLVSPSCEIEGAGRRLVWLGRVAAADSLALLEPVLDGDDEELADSALMAVAHHAGPEAEALLERRVLDPSLARDARRNAIFWTGLLRDATGVEILDRLLDREPDGELRGQALFALSQNGAAEALPRLRRAAAGDRDPEVRGQGLFWLAQSDDPEAGAWIYGRLAAESDEEVLEQGVFALSQLDDGADWLLRILQSGEHRELARTALFWLGQSEDPRAFAELERLLD